MISLIQCSSKLSSTPFELASSKALKTAHWQDLRLLSSEVELGIGMSAGMIMIATCWKYELIAFEDVTSGV
jgi:hypothetical protein